MSATKRASRPAVQRVAKCLVRRGDSYVFRKTIPKDVRAAFGAKTAIFKSFGSISRKEAERLAASHRAYYDEQIEAARHSRSSEREHPEKFQTPNKPRHADIERAVRAWVTETVERERTSGRAEPDRRVLDLKNYGEEVRLKMKHREGEIGLPITTQWIVEELSARHGWQIEDQALRQHLEECVFRGQREFVSKRIAELEYEDTPAPTSPIFKEEYYEQDRSSEKEEGAAVSISTIMEGFLAENERPIKTRKKWAAAASSLIEFLGHDDVTSLSSESIIAWKNFLLTPSPLGVTRKPQTVQNNYIAPLRGVFNWGIRNKLMTDNPVTGTIVRSKPRVRKRPEKGYTAGEAKIVLAASHAIKLEEQETLKGFACRWLPWLCAYSGARVGEMAQVRRDDVRQDETGKWYMLLTPDAGSTKDSSARYISLHPHLLQHGFVEAIEDKNGPIFYNPANSRGGTGNSQAAKVGDRVRQWVRGLGLTDPELQPNHGWRHRFITVGHSIGMPETVSRAITGHSARDVHQTYGNVPLETIHEWIAKVPRYEV